MVTYKNGSITKNNIYIACKELFYTKGYKDTTYVDICNRADVSPGAITHFFQSKKMIAINIYSDFLTDIKDKTKEYLSEKYQEYNLRVASALEQIIFTNLIYTNENYRKFYYDICVDSLLLESYIDKMSEFYKIHSDTYHLNLSETQIRLLQITSTSISLGVTRKWLEGYLEGFSKEDYSNYRIKIMFYLMDVSDDETNEIIKKACEIYLKMKIGLLGIFAIEIK